MGYTPKHAKPVSLASATRASRHGLFAISGPSKGRHAAIGTTVAGDRIIVTGGGTAVPAREDKTVIRERNAA